MCEAVTKAIGSLFAPAIDPAVKQMNKLKLEAERRSQRQAKEAALAAKVDTSNYGMRSLIAKGGSRGGFLT